MIEEIQKEKELIQKDKELISRERDKLSLKKPTQFEMCRISPEDISNLIPLMQIPFLEQAIVRKNTQGFKSKGVPLPLQLMRLYEIFGAEHIKFEHNVIEVDTVKKEEKNDMYYYKISMNLKIGNWTMYTDQNTTPCSTFVTCYEVDGIGYAGNTSKGTAEKNAIANGKKECLKNMGTLAYLYLEEEDSLDYNEFDDSTNYPSTKIVLIDKPIIYDKSNSKLFLKGMATDVKNNSEVEIIIYRENPQMNEEHNKMIEALRTYKHSLVKSKELAVEYIEGTIGKPQYVIRRIFWKKQFQNDNTGGKLDE